MEENKEHAGLTIHQLTEKDLNKKFYTYSKFTRSYWVDRLSSNDLERKDSTLIYFKTEKDLALYAIEILKKDIKETEESLRKKEHKLNALLRYAAQ